MNCTRYTEEDCLGSDHLPIITELNENIKDDEPEDEDKIPKFKYKHADWEAYQAFLISSDINFVINVLFVLFKFYQDSFISSWTIHL